MRRRCRKNYFVPRAHKADPILTAGVFLFFVIMVVITFTTWNRKEHEVKELRANLAANGQTVIAYQGRPYRLLALSSEWTAYGVPADNSGETEGKLPVADEIPLDEIVMTK